MSRPIFSVIAGRGREATLIFDPNPPTTSRDYQDQADRIFTILVHTLPSGTWDKLKVLFDQGRDYTYMEIDPAWAEETAEAAPTKQPTVAEETIEF